MDKYYGKVKAVTIVSYEGSDTAMMTIENFNIEGQPTRMEYYIHNFTTPYQLEEFLYDNKGNKKQTINIARGDTTIRDYKSSNSSNISVVSRIEKKTNPLIPHGAHTKVWGTIRSSKEKTISTHFHNKQGYLIEIQDVDESGNLIRKTVIGLDSRGNEIRRSSFQHDTLQYVIIQSYDRYSNSVTTQRINRNQPPGEKEILRYDYDKHHNWTNKYVLKKNKEVLVEKQVIEYY